MQLANDGFSVVKKYNGKKRKKQVSVHTLTCIAFHRLHKLKTYLISQTHTHTNSHLCKEHMITSNSQARQQSNLCQHSQHMACVSLFPPFCLFHSISLHHLSILGHSISLPLCSFHSTSLSPSLSLATFTFCPFPCPGP